MLENVKVACITVSCALLEGWRKSLIVELGEGITDEKLCSLTADELYNFGDCLIWGDLVDEVIFSELEIEVLYYESQKPPVMRLSLGNNGELICQALDACPDCGTAVGQLHEKDCDIERCTACKSQRISCDCGPPAKKRDVWEGTLDCLGTSG